MTAIQIGRLLRSSTTGFVAGCRVKQFENESPQFGEMVRTPFGQNYQAYGLIYNIHIDDDGLVRQLVTANDIDTETIADNRENRTVPIEMTVLAVGYEHKGQVFHLIPPRPPLSLDIIQLCTNQEIIRFAGAGQFGYFRHVLRTSEIPASELIAAHLKNVHTAYLAEGKTTGEAATLVREAAQTLITLLRDDYATLMEMLSAIGDALPAIWA